MAHDTFMPYHRIPTDVHPPPLLVPGRCLYDGDQTVEEAEEVYAYLTGYLTLVTQDRRTQVFHSRGGQN